MARKRRLHKRYGRKRNGDGGGFKSNPPLLTDLAEFVGPGFAAFAATRFVTRVAAVQLAKKKPSWGKHAGAVASVASFLAAWFGAHRIKFTEKYHTPIVVGSAIAMFQSLIQLYIPKLGWMLADASPEIAELKVGGTVQRAQLPADLEYVDDEDPNAYTYNDSYDPGRYAKNGTGAGTTAAPSSAANKVAAEEDMLADLGLAEDDLGELNLGSLGAN